jgi:hypothetical protein
MLAASFPTAALAAAAAAASLLRFWYDGSLQPHHLLQPDPEGGVFHEHSAAKPSARLLQVSNQQSARHL